MTVRPIVVILGVVAFVAAPADGRSAARNGLIAVATVDRIGGSEIRLLTADLKSRRIVAVQPSVDLPRFSPNGRWLAFWAGPDPDRSVPWVAEAGGLHARPLLPVPSAREPTSEYWGAPIWAPDSRTLAYVDEHANQGSMKYFSTIHLVGLDGRSDHVMSITGWRGSRPPASFALVAWRGQRMLLKGTVNSASRDYVLDLGSRTITLLPGVDSLSPSGRSVACADAGKLSVIDLTTRVRRRITTVTDVQQAPLWSRYGSSLAFTTSAGVAIISLARSSTAPRLIRALATNLVWSPDGRYLLTDRPALLGIRSGTVVPLHDLSPSLDYGSPVDWQSR